MTCVCLLFLLFFFFFLFFIFLLFLFFFSLFLFFLAELDACVSIQVINAYSNMVHGPLSLQVCSIAFNAHVRTPSMTAAHDSATSPYSLQLQSTSMTI